MNVFKPKDKEEILKGFLWTGLNDFQKQMDQFEAYYGEKVPEKYYPLIYTIHNDLQDRKDLTTKHNWGETAFIKRVRGETTRFILKSRSEQKYVSITMFPFRKRKSVSDITFGNEFRITSLEQYLEFIDAYEL